MPDEVCAAAPFSVQTRKTMIYIMKKLLVLLFAAVVLVLPACNEDATEYDAAYSSQLIGTWNKSFENSEMMKTENYRFDEGRFTYACSILNIKESKERSYTVGGSWNIYKGVLQVSYDLESLQTRGYSDTEKQDLYDNMEDANLMLKQMNDEDKPFGSTIEFEVLNGQEIMRLSGVNGYFVRISR